MGGWSVVPSTLAIMALAVLPAEAVDGTPASLALACAGRLASGEAIAALGQDLDFKATIPFEDGRFIALISPETSAVRRLLYGSEVLDGSIAFGADAAREIVWTRATSRKGTVTGLFVDESGGVTSLTIRAAPQGSGDRPFDLFATAPGAVYRGSCH